ncbi:flagellar basal body-associated FliL family protein [Inhella proteolytica]|uniref:Flagellar protein FliL n=1 Tax=Inhella proteolytica TaxID=2795029 RepID=A0A931NGW8_9BURK|nr:flagellar basal body-associated FliL family protein [Inhella proteolytica]MBH9575885.1 flagellar basal body-associated FliL family protein [Inhella proteolytica]
MATAAPEAAAPAAGSKKKLIMIIVIGLVVVLVGAAAALLLLKKKHTAAEEDGAEEDITAQVEKAKPKAKSGTPPVYLPVEPFTVNLTDKEVDRYAQVAVSLEVVDQKTADELKNYMPSIRSGVLMVLAHKSAADLLTKEGKERLQKEIQREALRPLGIEVELEEEAPPDEETDTPKKKKKKKKKAEPNLPVTNVLFSQFIVQ